MDKEEQVRYLRMKYAEAKTVEQRKEILEQLKTIETDLQLMESVQTQTLLSE